MIQRFWDSAMALSPLDDETDTQSQMRLHMSRNFFVVYHLSVYMLVSPFYFVLSSEASRSQMMSDVHQDSMGGSEAAYPSLFSFKLQDRRGRMHRFSCGTNVQLTLPFFNTAA